jgi:uncharacterized repeat protein (TIGR02059 family)
MKRIIFLFSLVICSVVSAKTYYVATNGNNSYTAVQAQNINTPWATWQKAINSMASGDTIFIRGGVYYLSGMDPWVTIDPTIGKGKSGTKTARSCLWAYPPDYASGNFPILDCRNAKTAYETNYSAVGLNATQYWHIKGLTVRNAFQRGVSAVRPQGFGGTNSANVVFENCTAHDITARGFYYESGAWNAWDGAGSPFTSDTTRWINCDSYNICDSVSLSSGDAWKCGNYVGGVFYFTGCRAWNYGDDGIDPSGAGKKIFDNCWVMSTNKYITLGGIEGNGIKTAGFGDNQIGHFDPNDHYVVVRNCIAAYCFGYGFYNNLEASAQNNALYLNNTAYKTYGGFSDIFHPVTRTSEYRNNISIYSTSKQSGMDPLYEVAIYYPSTYPGSNNNWLGTNSVNDWPGWQYNPAVTVTDADFVSVNANELTTPRKSDGSLPDINFLKLAAGSDLIDKGIDVGLPYYGSAPDLGYAEYNSGTVTPPSPLYITSVIENATPAILEMTYSLALANVIPATSAFTVMVNSSPRTVTAVTISGTKVRLTLASPIVYGNVVTVAYTKPATNMLQTAAGGQAATISPQNVTYNVAAFVYVSSVIENATPSRLEITYNSTLANVVPSPSDFTVLVNFIARTVTNVSIVGAKVQLTLSSPVVYGNVVTIGYKKPASNFLQSTAGVPASTITGQSVTNNVQPVAGNQPPVVSISSPGAGTPFTALATVNIAVTASDADGTVSKVEIYAGATKIAEITSLPWTYTWEYVKAGTYSLVAIATDNQNASNSSTPVEVVVDPNPLFEGTSKFTNLYPNPSDGNFEITLTQPTQTVNSEITIISADGRTIHHETIGSMDITKTLVLPLLKSGTYIIVLSADGVIFDTKLFVRK